MTNLPVKPIDDQALIENGIDTKDLMFFITLRCNLRCKICYLGNRWLDEGISFSDQEAASLLTHFGQQGLDRLTFLGGEPFLHPHITDLVLLSKTLNIKEKRLTTNALDLGFFDLNRLKGDELSHISVSFDGITSKTHEYVRGPNTFQRTIDNVKRLIDHGFRVHTNLTVNGVNKYEVADSPAFFQKIGAKEVNYHLISMIGNAKKYPDLSIEPEEWIDIRKQLEKTNNVHGVSLRIPYMYVTPQEYQDLIRKKKYYPIQSKSYYSKNGQRIVLYPNGRVYISCDLSGTDYNFATYRNYKFSLNRQPNELSLFKQTQNTPDISSQLLHLDNKGYVRLSISYKEKIHL